MDHPEMEIDDLINEVLRLSSKEIVTTLLTQGLLGLNLPDRIVGALLYKRIGFVSLSVITTYVQLADEYRTMYSIKWHFGSQNSDEEILGEYKFNVKTSDAIRLYQAAIELIIRHQPDLTNSEIEEFLAKAA